MACILCLVFSMLIVRWGYQLKPETQREQETKGTEKTFHLAPLNCSQYKSLRMKNMMTYISVIYF